MVLLLLFLTIPTIHGSVQNYEILAPDDYLGYRNEDFHHVYNDNTEPETPVDNIKYNELLSLLHNDYSNKVLLAQIFNQPTDATVKTETEITTEIPKLNPVNPAPNNQEFKDNTRVAGHEWNRMKRDDTLETTVNESKVVPLTNNLNSLNVDDKVSDVIGKSSHDFKNVTKVTKDLNSTKGDTAKLRSDSNYARPRRDTVLKLLQKMFHPTVSTTTAKAPIVTPLRGQQTEEPKVEPALTDLIENLIKSIKEMNENLANLKLHVNDNVGFVMIKVPISNVEGKKYLKNIPMDKTRREIDDKVRSKRDLAVSTESNVNSTRIMNVTSFNITKNDNNIVDEKEDFDPTIISDSETINKLKELAKTKRNVNITTTEENDSTNDSIVSTTEGNTKTNSRVTDSNETSFTQKDESKIKPESEQLNTSKEKTRRYLGNRDDLLFFIDEAYSGIKHLISPINDIRVKYSAAPMYKIGYIIANLDTMDTTLKKMKNKIFRNAWDTNRLQKVLKKLNMSKKLVENVMGYLKMYADSRNQLLGS